MHAYTRTCVHDFHAFTRVACARAHSQPLCTCTCKRPAEAVLVSATTARGPRFEVHRIIKRLRGSDTRLRVLRRPRWNHAESSFSPDFSPSPLVQTRDVESFFLSFVSFRARIIREMILESKESYLQRGGGERKRESWLSKRCELTRFGSWLSRPVNGHFDRLCVGGDLEGYRADLDGQ